MYDDELTEEVCWGGSVPPENILYINTAPKIRMRYVPERTCQNITRHPHYGFECSECGWDAYEPNDYGNDVRFDEFSYCPKCGCKVEQQKTDFKGQIMNFKDFIDLYDNWNGVTVVNDDKLSCRLINNTALVAEDDSLWDMEVVSFGFYDNQLCIRVK